MKTTITLTIAIFHILTNEVTAQTDSPIGNWLITEHLVSEYDSTQSKWNERNVLPDEFKSNIYFKKSGEFEYYLEDTVYSGNWKLSKNQRKLTINAGSTNYKSRWKQPYNFESPFHYPTRLDQFYTTQNDTLFGGISVYFRINGEKPAIDTSLLIGKWLVTHIQVGIKKVEDESNWTIEFNSDGTYVKGNRTGNWKVNGHKLTLDPNDSNNSQALPYTSKIEFLSKDEFRDSGMEGKFKKATIYWKKIKN